MPKAIKEPIMRPGAWAMINTKVFFTKATAVWKTKTILTMTTVKLYCSEYIDAGANEKWIPVWKDKTKKNGGVEKHPYLLVKKIQADYTVFVFEETKQNNKSLCLLFNLVGHKTRVQIRGSKFTILTDATFARSPNLVTPTAAAAGSAGTKTSEYSGFRSTRSSRSAW